MSPPPQLQAASQMLPWPLRGTRNCCTCRVYYAQCLRPLLIERLHHCLRMQLCVYHRCRQVQAVRTIMGCTQSLATERCPNDMVGCEAIHKYYGWMAGLTARVYGVGSGFISSLPMSSCTIRFRNTSAIEPASRIAVTIGRRLLAQRARSTPLLWSFRTTSKRSIFRWHVAPVSCTLRRQHS
jgi:hypothetical protein